jgi:hypothetical protein
MLRNASQCDVHAKYNWCKTPARKNSTAAEKEAVIQR